MTRKDRWMMNALFAILALMAGLMVWQQSLTTQAHIRIMSLEREVKHLGNQWEFMRDENGLQWTVIQRLLSDRSQEWDSAPLWQQRRRNIQGKGWVCITIP